MNYPFYPYQNQQVQLPPQMQSGFVTVPTEQDALRYPIAPGNSITFKIESQPVMIEKTMGFSQLDSPKIKRFKLVEENVETMPAPEVEYALKSDLLKLAEEVEALKAPKRRKKEEVEDE